MNWTRGLIRLWIITSIAFIAYTDFDSWQAAKSQCWRNNLTSEDCNKFTWKQTGNTAIGSLILSGLFFAAGSGVVWTVRGLQRN